MKCQYNNDTTLKKDVEQERLCMCRGSQYAGKSLDFSLNFGNLNPVIASLLKHESITSTN